MLTRIRIKNFKRFETVEFELGKTVVLIGPNNSGKTAALQALALWDIGLRRWNEKWGAKKSPEKRPGVTINRRDLISIPVPSANLLWRDLHVREIERTNGKQRTQNIRIDIIVDGITEGNNWSCGFEFDYANVEAFFCRPLRLNEDEPQKRMPVPNEAASVKVAYLPPMSGLADREFIKQAGEIGVLIGQGQTAQVLRNLCYQIYGQDGDVSKPEWEELTARIEKLFGVKLLPPEYIKERGEIVMSYQEPNGLQLDISSSGRGLQQTLLLLAHLFANPNTVLLLDEPDAHLEVLRQRQTYQLLTEVADQKGSQIIAASHSEVVLNEAADRDIVIAFVGSPHRINGKTSQLVKALTDLGFDQYYQAEQTGWVLYLEGPTDLAILQAFAAELKHPATECLERPFVHYVATNRPQKARDHFFGLREAKPDLVGLALFDKLEKELQAGTPLTETMWRRKEIENYFCRPEVLLAYARADQPDDLFGQAEANRREQIMRQVIEEVTSALRTLGKGDPWSPDIKATDDFLDPLFREYFKILGLPNLMQKTDYHVLARLLPKDQIDPEIIEKLDAIVGIAKQAKPRAN
ncbi:MAG TPA: AAA family ATPase [Blastocatellia bacterium]|nr:AAA family ATPase [Blastocatellia bacterium]